MSTPNEGTTLDPRQRALTTKPGPAATRIRAYQSDRASRTSRTRRPLNRQTVPGPRRALGAPPLTNRRPYQGLQALARVSRVDASGAGGSGCPRQGHPARRGRAPTDPDYLIGYGGIDATRRHYRLRVRTCTERRKPSGGWRTLTCEVKIAHRAKRATVATMLRCRRSGAYRQQVAASAFNRRDELTHFNSASSRAVYFRC